MRRLRSLLLGPLLLPAAGCTTVGPDYKLPEAATVNMPAAQGAFLGANNPAVAQSPVPGDWWRLYDNPMLDSLIRDALSANTDIRVAAANLQRAQAIVTETRSESDVQGRASASAAREQASGEQYLLSEQIPVSDIGDVGLGVSYDLDLFGKLRRATEAAKADAEATQAALDLARVNVAGQVAAAYLEACSSGAELAVAQRSIALQQTQVAVTQRLVAAGRGTALDLSRARALLAQVRASAPLHEAQRKAALFRITALMGKPPAEYPPAVAACTTLPRLHQPIPVGDGAALLARRPDVRQAERQLASATARIGIAVSALYPEVSLGFSAGSTGLLSDLGEAQTNRWSLGSLISWTFPTSGTRARIRAAGAVADGALAHFDGVVLNALRETETSLSAYAQDLDRNADLRVARDQARLAQSQAQRLYRAGSRPFLDALDADRTLAQADATLAASNGQLAADQARLFLALGGGWQQAPQPKMVPATDRSPSLDAKGSNLDRRN